MPLFLAPYFFLLLCTILVGYLFAKLEIGAAILKFKDEEINKEECRKHITLIKVLYALAIVFLPIVMTVAAVNPDAMIGVGVFFMFLCLVIFIFKHPITALLFAIFCLPANRPRGRIRRRYGI